MSKKRGLSSERIAKRLLESRGFHILSTRYSIMEGDEKIAEVDIVAENTNGNRYAIEVKAGRGDVDSIRQTYGNAKLCGYKPLLICKGFADDAARKAALKLNVDVVELRKEYGPKLLMFGNVDKRELAKGPDAIHREVARKIPLAVEGGFIIGVDHAVPHDVSFDNYSYYVETLRRLGGTRR